MKRYAPFCIAILGLSIAADDCRADEALDAAFTALKTYDWGQDRSVLQPIDVAVAAVHSDAAARAALEKRLAVVLASDAPKPAKDFVCRQLSLVATAASVPQVAPLLKDEKLSHMGRYVLERVPGEEAASALRDALPEVDGRLKIGIINSLGARRDEKSVSALAKLVQSSDVDIAKAATAALGAIGNDEAAKVLGGLVSEGPEELRLVAADAYLSCAERFLAGGNKLQAMAIYRALTKAELPKHLQLAATRGLLAAVKKKP